MVLKGKEKEKLQEYFKAKIIGEYDLSPREREKHDADMKKKRDAEENARKAKQVQVSYSLPPLEERYFCSNPEAKLIDKETFVCEIELTPPCPKCKTGILRYEEYSAKGKPVANYICQNCFAIVSQERYEELEKKLEHHCIEKDHYGTLCDGKLLPQQTYPWILECVKCHKVYTPEEQENLPGAIKSSRPVSITGPRTYPEEFEEDGDLYDCPIYHCKLRIREDYRCKQFCGYRDKK